MFYHILASHKLFHYSLIMVQFSDFSKKFGITSHFSGIYFSLKKAFTSQTNRIKPKTSGIIILVLFSTFVVSLLGLIFFTLYQIA